MSSYIKQIQTTLKQAGLYKGEIDGIAGKQTVEAVKAAAANEILDAEAKRAVQEQARSNPLIPDVQPAPATGGAGGFTLSAESLKRLEGVKPDLVKVVKRAIELTSVDFRVLEGVRSKARQAELLKKGATRTMNSRHLTGDAADLVAIVGGKVSWDFNHYYPIAEAMASAADELGVRVRWGGCWCSINNSKGSAVDWVKTYRAGGGKFLDGPHFELPR